MSVVFRFLHSTLPTLVLLVCACASAPTNSAGNDAVEVCISRYSFENEQARRAFLAANRATLAAPLPRRPPVWAWTVSDGMEILAADMEGGCGRPATGGALDASHARRVRLGATTVSSNELGSQLEAGEAFQPVNHSTTPFACIVTAASNQDFVDDGGYLPFSSVFLSSGLRDPQIHQVNDVLILASNDPCPLLVSYLDLMMQSPDAATLGAPTVCDAHTLDPCGPEPEWIE